MQTFIVITDEFKIKGNTKNGQLKKGKAYFCLHYGFNDIKKGDKFYLLMSSGKSKGIIMHGTFNENLKHMNVHWANDENLLYDYFNVIDAEVLDYKNKEVLPIDDLYHLFGNRQKWKINESGKYMDSYVATKLSKLWKNTFEKYQIYRDIKKSYYDKGEKAKGFTFGSIGLKKGDKIYFTQEINDNDKTSIVYDDKNVLYRNKKYTLTALAKKFSHTRTHHLPGPSYFSCYDKSSKKIVPINKIREELGLLK